MVTILESVEDEIYNFYIFVFHKKQIDKQAHNISRIGCAHVYKKKLLGELSICYCHQSMNIEEYIYIYMQ